MIESQDFRWDSIIEKFTHPFLITDRENQILFIHSEAKKILNYQETPESPTPVNQLLGLTPEQIKNMELCAQQGLLFHGQGLVEHNSQECSSIDFQVKSFYLSDSDREFFLFEFAKEARAILDPCELQALGRCIGKLSHDLSNPLAIVKIQCESFDLWAKKQDPLESQKVIEKVGKMNLSLDKLISQVESLKSLAKNLLDLDEELIKSRISEKEEP